MFPLHWLLMILEYFGKPENNSESGGVLDLKYWLSKVPLTVLEPICLSFVTPYVFILAATYISPSHKFKTAIAMAVLVVVGLGACAALLANSPNLQLSDSGVMMALKGLFLLAGLGLGIYNARALDERA